MKILQTILHRLIYPACLIFTCTTILLTGILASTAYNNYAPPIQALLAFFGFSLIVAALNQLFRLERMNLFFKILLHYLGFMLGFFLVFALIYSGIASGIAAFYIGICLTVVYFLITAFVLLIRGLFVTQKKKEDTYQSQFRKF